MGYEDAFSGEKREVDTSESVKSSYWSIGDHPQPETNDEEDVTLLKRIANRIGLSNMSEVIEEADERSRDIDVAGFQCNICGLPHTHSDSKHDLRSSLNKGGVNLNPEFAKNMHYSPYCHCAPHELYMILDYWSDIGQTVFTDEENANFSIDDRRETVKEITEIAEIGDHVINHVEGELRQEVESILAD